MSNKPDPQQSTLTDEELELLYRVDERTERIDDRVEGAVDQADSNANEIGELKGKVRRNTTILSGITGGLGMILMWASDKVSRFM